MDYNLVAIKVEDREGTAPQVQEVLTKFGCNIRVRLGLHDQPGSCSPTGLIILDLAVGGDEVADLLEDLDGIPGATAKFMEL